ncbi:transmembrane protein 100-like [Neoarius graeffei]|uniref:transmembrane protein 100-like n=1 Tax=Neoarius graeffei TaxID=443677 RepID=UPI00298CEB98|nr:transmembrane protein 100-like [Neoarius graeffei]XP_060777685.1 transmembrane protein 100-like [Neoarius graeffei]
MEPVLDLSSLPQPTPTVTYNPKSETVTFPSGVVSVAGVTVITGGTELSCSSCMLAFGFWGTLVGLSALCVGLREYFLLNEGNISNLLAMGLVILIISLGIMVGVFGIRFIKKKTGIMRRQKEEGKVVLVNEGGQTVIKKMTV